MQTLNEPEIDVLEILASGSDGMYAVDSNQRVVVWNKHAELILGWKSGEVLGSHCHEIVGGMSQGESVCGPNCPSFSMAKSGEVPPSHTVRSRTKSGDQRWINISHVLIPNDQRKLGALVHIFRDVTESQEATETVKRILAVIPSHPNVNVTIGFQKPDETVPATNPLSKREVELLRMLAEGKRGDDIAKQLVLSDVTVRNHIQHILTKLKVRNRLEAVILASRQKLI